MDEQQKPYEVTEEDFNKAINNASLFARRRLARKMEKKKHRACEFLVTYKEVVSPLTGETLLVPDLTKPYGPTTNYLPPADLEQYVTNFVLVNKDKDTRTELEKVLEESGYKV